MILPILTHPNQIIRNVSTNVPEVTEEIRSLAGDMIETMIRAQGIGLAAPQIGRNICLLIAGDKSPIAMVNPIIKNKSFRKDIMEEGCLSIPGVYVKVKRSVAVTVEYTDLEGNRKIMKRDDILARVIQHEIDHLNGILIIDRISNS